MNHLDRIRISRALDAAGYNGSDILSTLDSAGIHLRVLYEEPRKVHMINVEHDL